MTVPLDDVNDIRAMDAAGVSRAPDAAFASLAPSCARRAGNERIPHPTTTRGRAR